MNESQRGTGRTTHMLEKAIEYAKDGKTVYVICVNHQHEHELRQILSSLITQRRESIEKLRIICISPGSYFDWNTRRSPGMAANSLVLVDHYTMERHIRDMFENRPRIMSEQKSIVKVNVYLDDGRIFSYDVADSAKAREHAHTIATGGYRHTVDGCLEHYPAHRILMVKVTGKGIDTNYPDVISGT